MEKKKAAKKSVGVVIANVTKEAVPQKSDRRFIHAAKEIAAFCNEGHRLTIAERESAWALYFALQKQLHYDN